ncbi:MAG: VOC family protein [Candidatus Doudnabacteria bacterium]|nr:VOC family protein [Candidatus Doudnabacteria bacterium]
MHIYELGHAVLYVTNIDRMAAFYRDTLGFTQIGQGQGMALFSSGRTHHELLLLEIGGNPIPPGPVQPGLYHLGFKIGNSTEELQTALHELRAAGIRIVGAADHTVTHSLYVLDPDGNELELYADVSDVWKTDPSAVLSPTKPLQLE